MTKLFTEHSGNLAIELRGALVLSSFVRVRGAVAPLESFEPRVRDVLP